MADTDTNNNGAGAAVAQPPAATPDGAGAATGTPPPPLSMDQPALPAPNPDVNRPSYPVQYGSMAEAAPTPTPTDHLKGDSFGAKVYHGVLGALAGTKDVTLTGFDQQTGKPQYSVSEMGPGQQWKKIIAGAITGLAAGAGQTGPGSSMRKFGMGEQAGQQQVEKQHEREQQEAQQTFQNQQAAALQNARVAMVNHQITKMVYDLGRDKVKAAQEDIDRENQLTSMIEHGGAGSVDLGVMPDFDSAVKKAQQVPELHDHQVNGRIVGVAHTNENGNFDGMHYAYVTPQMMDQKIKQDIPLKVQTADGKEVSWTVKADDATYRDVLGFIQAQAKDALTEKHKDIQEKREGAVAEATIAEKMANAHKLQADTNVGGGGMGEMDDAAEGLSTGRYLMGKDFPTRTSKDQAQAREYNRAAQDYSQKTFGLNYSPEIIRQESHFANTPKVQAFLDSIDRMIGTPDGTRGQLDQLLDIAKAAGIGKSNAPYQQAKIAIRNFFGERTAKKFDEILSDTQTSLGTLVGNPLLGSGESDLKLRTAQRQFGSNFTMANLQDQVDVAKDILERSRVQMAKKNRYIQMRYGQVYSPAQQQQQAQAGAGQRSNAQPAAQGGNAPGPLSTPQPWAANYQTPSDIEKPVASARPGAQPGAGKSISLAAARNLPQYKNKTDAQITADAEGLGYKVNQ